MEQQNTDGGTVDNLMVEQWNNHDGTVEHLMVEQWNILWLNSGTSDGGTVEHLMGGTVEQRLWNCGTEIMEQQNTDGGTVDNLMVEQWNNHDGTVEHLMVEQWNILWLNSGTSDGGTVKQS